MGMLPGRTDQLSIRNLLEEKSLEMENQKRQTEFCQRAAGAHHVANRFNSTKLNYTGDTERERTWVLSGEPQNQLLNFHFSVSIKSEKRFPGPFISFTWTNRGTNGVGTSSKRRDSSTFFFLLFLWMIPLAFVWYARPGDVSQMFPPENPTFDSARSLKDVTNQLVDGGVCCSWLPQPEPASNVGHVRSAAKGTFDFSLHRMNSFMLFRLCWFSRCCRPHRCRGWSYFRLTFWRYACTNQFRRCFSPFFSRYKPVREGVIGWVFGHSKSESDLCS